MHDRRKHKKKQSVSSLEIYSDNSDDASAFSFAENMTKIKSTLRTYRSPLTTKQLTTAKLSIIGEDLLLCKHRDKGNAVDFGRDYSLGVFVCGYLNFPTVSKGAIHSVGRLGFTGYQKECCSRALTRSKWMTIVLDKVRRYLEEVPVTLKTPGNIFAHPKAFHGGPIPVSVSRWPFISILADPIVKYFKHFGLGRYHTLELTLFCYSANCPTRFDDVLLGWIKTNHQDQGNLAIKYLKHCMEVYGAMSGGSNPMTQTFFNAAVEEGTIYLTLAHLDVICTSRQQRQ